MERVVFKSLPSVKSLKYLSLFGFQAMLIRGKVSSRFNGLKYLLNFAFSKAYLPD